MTSLPEPLPQILPVQTKQAASTPRGSETETSRAAESSSRFSDRLRQQDNRPGTAATRERAASETGQAAKPAEQTKAPPSVTEDGSTDDASDVTLPPALIVPVLVLPEVALPELEDLNVLVPGLVEAEGGATAETGDDPLLAALAKLLGLPQSNATQAVALEEMAVETIDTSLTQPLTKIPVLTGAPTSADDGSEGGLSLTLPLIGLPVASTTTDDGQPTLSTGIAAGLATVSPLANQTQTGTDTGGDAPLPEAPLLAANEGERGATAFTAVLATADETAMTTTTTATTQVDAAPKASAEQRPAAPVANPMERAVAQQVSRALLREGADGLRLTLRLTPPELGTVRIEIVERGGILQAHIHAEDDAVRVALERQLPQLRQDLRSHDAPVRDVHLGDAWSGEFTRQDRNQTNGRGNGNRQRSAFSIDGIANAARATPAAPVLGATIAEDAVDARA